MIKIRLVCVGNIKEKYLNDAIDEYFKRISRYFNVEIIEVAESKKVKVTDADIPLILKDEAKNILPKLNGYVCALCINGKELDSKQFAEFINTQSQSNSTITFVIGGSYGLDDAVLNVCNYKLSYSKMTFPHKLMRVIFFESLYRAGSILNNTPYHK